MALNFMNVTTVRGRNMKTRKGDEGKKSREREEITSIRLQEHSNYGGKVKAIMDLGEV
ncbi:hypothetical protein Glove_109g236 [Diversispora epigaea]|uniref:Uncharacterized protein n=1 Tax=Diversispora epigaea TaxID=1348612 RepID=A0A397J275_9GLOM|nr:hypothetical protein Glove_109g236 [Diversispora epigaea]